MHVDICTTVFEMYGEVILGLCLHGSKIPWWKVMAKRFGTKAPVEKMLING